MSVLLIFILGAVYSPTHVGGVSSVDRTTESNNRNENLFNVNLTSPIIGLPANEMILINNPVALNGYGQAGLQVQILVDGRVIGIAPINDHGQWSLVADLGEPGTHYMEVMTINQSNQVVNASTSIEVILLDPTFEQIIKNNLNTSVGGCRNSAESAIDEPSVSVMPDEVNPIVCHEGSSNNHPPVNTCPCGESGSGAEQINTPTPILPTPEPVTKG